MIILDCFAALAMTSRSHSLRKLKHTVNKVPPLQGLPLSRRDSTLLTVGFNLRREWMQDVVIPNAVRNLPMALHVIASAAKQSSERVCTWIVSGFAGVSLKLFERSTNLAGYAWSKFFIYPNHLKYQRKGISWKAVLLLTKFE